MKKMYYFYFGTGSLFSSVLKRIKDSSESKKVILLKKRISFGIDGIQKSEKFKYNGNKLISVTVKDGSVFKYSYNGNLIAQIDEIDNKGKLCCKTEFIYAKGKLSCRIKTISDAKFNKKIRYDHHEDDSISYELSKLNVVTGEQYNKVISGKFKFKARNLIKNEILKENSDILELFSYDTNRNPLKNVLGIDLLLNYESINNLLNKTVISRTDEGIYFMSTTTCSYKYNENNYPTEKIEIYENGDCVSKVRTAYIY